MQDHSQFETNQGNGPLPSYLVPLFEKKSLCKAFVTENEFDLPEKYPGPRGFHLFFTGKFCSANRFYYFCYRHEAVRALKASSRDR